jgi:hypothetical protein
MTFRKLFFQCECGRSAARVRDLGVTARQELVVRWRCAGCKRRVLIVTKLSDCWGPSIQSGRGQTMADQEDVTAFDIQFLRSLAVRLPTEVDA